MEIWSCTTGVIIKIFGVKVKIFDTHCRYQHMDGDLGIVIEPDSLPADIYPYVKIEEAEEAACGGVKGSCATFRIELATKFHEFFTIF